MTETLPYDGANPDRGIAVDDRGEMSYDGASREGRVSVMLPSLPGAPRETETLHAVNFGAFVSGQVERSFQKQPYLKSGPQQKPAEVFRHFLGCAKGAALLDGSAIGRMEKLASEFEKESAQEEYFKQVIRPWLHDLSPQRR
jgi:hypothetical protein